ncbi:hypothetical protein GGP93_002111 [Salinibacter ruber]|nr:hypothetical protein [Salinibacter ruber]
MFTTDWHFGYGNILVYTDRNYRNVNVMYSQFIRNINSRMDYDDEPSPKYRDRDEESKSWSGCISWPG